MCFLHRIHGRVRGLVGVVSAVVWLLPWAAEGTTTFRLSNQSTGYASAYWSMDPPGYDVTIFSVAPGNIGTYNGSDTTYSNKSATVYMQQGNQAYSFDFCESESQGPFSPGATYTTTFYGCGVGPPAPTNGYSAWHITWTNNGMNWANCGLFLTDSNNVTTQLEPDVLRAYPPGKDADFWYTNSGAGGWLLFGDMRPDGTTDDYGGWGTWVPTDTPGSGGAGSDSGSSGHVVNVPGNPDVGIGTGTNGATQSDLNKLGSVMVGVGSAIERALGTLGASNSLGWGTNDGILREIEQNTGLTATNTFGITNLASLREAMWGWSTNAYHSLTGLYGRVLGGTNLMVEWSNQISGVSGLVATISAYGSGLEDLYEDASGLGEGAVPEAFGKLQPTVWGITVFTAEFADALSMEVMETESVGLRAWLRLIILWAAVAKLIWTYMGELREGIWHALTPTPVKGGGMILSTMGALVGNVPGFVAGTLGGYVLKGGAMIAIVAALIFIPTIIVTAISTAFTWAGINPNHLAANASGIVGSAPAHMLNVFRLVSAWFPVMELTILAINYAVAKLGLDGTVSILMVYCKAATPE